MIKLPKHTVFSLLPFLLGLPLVSFASPTPPTDPGQLEPLSAGSTLPEVQIALPSGESKELSEVLDHAPALLVFYRGGWCPFCTQQLQDLLTVEQELQDLGYTIYGLSPDSPETLREAAETIDLPYTLLSDASMDAAHAFGVAFQVDDATHQQLQGHGIDIEAASGKTHRLLPIPAVYLVDAEGTVTFAHYNPDYRERLSAEKTLAAARENATE